MHPSTEAERFYPFSILSCLVAYLSYAASKAVFLCCGVVLMLLLAPFSKMRYRVLHWVIHLYLALFTRVWLPAIRVYRVCEISGLETARRAAPAVFVANHRSFMDSIFLLGLIPNTGVVIKSRDTRQLMYRLLARYFDLVSVNRESLDSIAAALNKGARIVSQGTNLLVFPEGTRARSGRLQNFNRTAFQLAIEAGVPVVPVVVHSTKPFMAKVPGSIFPRLPNTFRIRFLDPEVLQPEDDAQALSDRVYKRMAQALKCLDAGTVWQR